MKKKLIIGLAILVIVGLAGLFAYKNFRQPTISNNSTEKSSSTVEIENFKFIPSVITVKPGEIITVLNKDIVNHSLTSNQEGLFDTGLIGKDQPHTFKTPANPGEYPFHCIPHPFMKGTLIVRE